VPKERLANMPQFFDLPRELRDMIYMAIVTWERPRPTLEDTANMWAWHLLNKSQTCLFASEQPPSTCANVLAASRQMHEETMQALDRARRAGFLVARMDCIAKKDSLRAMNHYFTWLSIPIVSRSRSEKKNSVRRGWVPNVPVVGRLLASPTRNESIDIFSTTIEELQIDIRLFDEDLEDGSQSGHSSLANTKWNVCAALKQICSHSKETDSWPASLTIDTLVLNVLAPGPTKSAQDDSDSRRKNARALARELVDIWNSLWSGGEYKSRVYGGLLEKIKRVRVCIDGVLVRERKLRLELERGQAERRRIAQRVGW
jgi:hypothetical protein